MDHLTSQPPETPERDRQGHPLKRGVPSCPGTLRDNVPFCPVLSPSWNRGPWAAKITDAERLARLRSLRAIVRVLAGPRGADLAAALKRAESYIEALADAADLLEQLPAVPLRHVLASYAELSRKDA